MWCFVSSVFLYSIAAAVAFTMLRRHKLGKFYSVMILLGAVIPCSLGMDQISMKTRNPKCRLFLKIDQ
jgi:hypothetical protein